ncbi:MAG: DHA2 family efflux MFS transporter permease subunit [Proteobacteria bacterium]|nr:MAG: DHA2 family efflux MFS transporter permease subunit [Pseudomonadota bacterium]
MTLTRANKTLLWIVATGFFMETLDSMIVNTALPAMATSLNESPLAMHSVIMAYSLTLAVLIPASGWFADRFGIKKTFLTAITIFSLGSILCALSPNLNFLIAARVIQGVGGSMLMPIGRLAILRVFPQSQFLTAMSFVAVPALIGPLIGPTLGGFLVQYASWHWIFLINIPVGVVGIYSTLRFMPLIPAYEVSKFDLKGFSLLAIMMVSISMAMEGVSDYGLQHATLLLLLMVGFAAFAGYVFHAVRHPERALFPLTLFKTRSFSIGLVGNLFARIGMAATPFLIPLLLQMSLGYTPVEAGSTMIPIAAAAIVCRRFAPPFIMAIGYRKFLICNTLILGVLLMSLATVSAHEPSWVRVIQLILFGTVNSLQFSAMNSLTLKDLVSRDTASGNSLLSMTQMLAMSFGVANAGALLTTFHAYFDRLGQTPIHAFQATFICLGVITCFSTFIFGQLERNTKNPPTHSPVEVV